MPSTPVGGNRSHCPRGRLGVTTQELGSIPASPCLHTDLYPVIGWVSFLETFLVVGVSFWSTTSGRQEGHLYLPGHVMALLTTPLPIFPSSQAPLTPGGMRLAVKLDLVS